MVKLTTIQKSNAQLPDFFLTFRPVVLFVGATNGIGRNSLRFFTKSTQGSKPRVYFVGRSRERGDRLKSELSTINPDGHYEFVCADVSEMSTVDNICREIMQKEEYLNLLFMSQGTAQHNAETSEKLRLLNAVVYYSKIRFAVNLLPMMKKAPGLRRVVAVFGAGLEGKVAPDDLDGRQNTMIRHRDNIASMSTLALDKLSQENPEISWIHNWPGFVEGGIWESLPGLPGVLMRTAVWLFLHFFYMDAEECGQRQMYMATSARFPPGSAGGNGAANGVSLVDDTVPAKSIDGKPAGGFYSLTEHGDPIPDKKINLLLGYKKDGTQEVVWKHTMETFERVTGKESV